MRNPIHPNDLGPAPKAEIQGANDDYLTRILELELHRGLTTLEAAQFLGISKHTLENARVSGRGPPFHRVGRLVRYTLQDILAFRRHCRSTSEGQGDV